MMILRLEVVLKLVVTTTAVVSVFMRVVMVQGQQDATPARSPDFGSLFPPSFGGGTFSPGVVAVPSVPSVIVPIKVVPVVPSAVVMTPLPTSTQSPDFGSLFPPSFGSGSVSPVPSTTTTPTSTFGSVSPVPTTTTTPTSTFGSVSPVPTTTTTPTSTTSPATTVNFTGPGYIACPLDEYQFNQCEFSFDVDCTVAQQEVCNATTPQEPTNDVTFQVAYFPLHCECVFAIGCPDSCEYFNDTQIPTLPPVTGFVNFTGIGNVTCPVVDLFNTPVPCEPIVVDEASCGTCDTTILDGTYGFTPGDEFVTFPLPCECVVLINCPDTCKVGETGESQNRTGLSFTGPGYIACPLDIYLFNQCEFSFDADCTVAQQEVCNATTPQEPTNDVTFQIAYFPLHCECVLADGCSDSCEYFNDTLPTLPPVTGFVNFTGIGNVTCPIADLINTPVPCEPIVVDEASCGTCDTTILDAGFTPGDIFVTFLLPCECVVVINCPDTCTFEATDGPTNATAALARSTDASAVEVSTKDETLTSSTKNSALSTSSSSVAATMNLVKPVVKVTAVLTMMSFLL